MRKLGIAMFLLPVLAGCAASNTDGLSRPGPAPGAARPDVEWHTARVGDEIVVELIDRRGYYRIERVELVGPAGQTVAAHDLARETVRDSARGYDGGGVALGGGYGGGHHGGLSFGFSIPLTGPRHEGTITRTMARIRPPDGYRPRAGGWAIKIVLTDPAGTERFAAIAPP